MQGPTPFCSEYQAVARLSKVKGLDGQLVAVVVDGLYALQDGLEVWVVPPSARGVRHTHVLRVQHTPGKPDLILTLAGVGEREAARELVGRTLLARIDASHNGPDALYDGFDASQGDPDVTRGGPDVECRGEAEDALRTSASTKVSASTKAPQERAAAGQARDAYDRAQHNNGPVFFDTKAGFLGALTAQVSGPAYDIWVVEGPHGRLEIPAVDAYVAKRDDACVLLALPEGFIEITAQALRKSHED